MNRIAAFALNTFREAMRNKLLYLILLFACALILSAWAIGQLSMHEEVRVARDLGLAGISFFGVVLSIVGGVNLVYQEIERKTVYALISKPIQRWQFVVGKYAGMALTLAVQVGLMSLVLCGTLLVQGAWPDGILVRAIVLLYGEVLVVTAVAILFSTFSTPMLSGLYAAGVTACGRFTPELRALIASKLKGEPQLAAALTAATQLIPDLHLFFVSGSTVNRLHVSVNDTYVDWAYVASASGYGLTFAACVLALAILIFSRRDFV
jgi:ABC-type transport system involved in multi-copper enzyme maturation permease subunit